MKFAGRRGFSPSPDMVCHNRRSDAGWTKAEEFFALPVERKDSAKAPSPATPTVTSASRRSSLARSRGVDAPADQKESFNGGPERAPTGVTDPRGVGLLLCANDLAGRSGGISRRLAGL